MILGPTRPLLVLAATAPELDLLASAARERRKLRDVLVIDANGDFWRIVDAVPSLLVSGARESKGLQSVEFEGRVERV